MRKGSGGADGPNGVEELAARRSALDLLRRELRREADILVARPGDLAAHLHNALWLDEGDAGVAGVLLDRARRALGGRVWLRLINRPAVDRSVLTQAFEAGSTVWGLAWSPTGDRLAVGCADGVVRLWDIARGTAIGVLAAGAGEVNALAWSPDGALVASGHDDRTVRLWDARTLEPAERLDAEDPGVLALGWSPDGERLAAAGEGGAVVTWERSRDWRRRVRGRHGSRVYALAWAPDGRRLASGDGHGVIEVWSLRRRWRGPATTLRDRELETQIAEILPAGTPREAALTQCAVMSLAWSPDGGRLAAGSRIGAIRQWDPAAGEPRSTVVGAASLGVPSMAFSPDGEVLAWGSGEGRLCLADLRDRALVLPVGHDNGVRAVAWSPDGELLASGGEDHWVRVWAARRQWRRPAGAATPPKGHVGSVFAACWSGDGTLLASSGSDQTVRLWDARTGESRGAVERLPSPALALAPAPDGVLLAPMAGNRVPLTRWNGSARSAEEGIEITGPVFSLALSPDGRWVASGDSAETIWLRALASGEPSGILLPPSGSAAGEPSPVWALAWSPDGALLASSSGRAGVVAWDVAARTPRAILDERGEAPARAGAGGPLMGFDDGQVEVIAVAHHGLAWSPDGRRLAAGKGAAIRVWNAADWRLERTLEGHAKWVTVVAWAPGGELLASGSSDCTVRVWEAATGACIAVAQLLSTIVALRFTADGRGVQAADDGTATANRPIPYELALCRP